MNKHLLNLKKCEWNCHLNKVYYYSKTKATLWYVTPVLTEETEG